MMQLVEYLKLSKIKFSEIVEVVEINKVAAVLETFGIVRDDWDTVERFC